MKLVTFSPSSDPGHETTITFTFLQDVLRELVVYHHDDTETSGDSLDLRVSDGDHGETKTLNIIVGLVNDETPRVAVNRGLRLRAGMLYF